MFSLYFGIINLHYFFNKEHILAKQFITANSYCKSTFGCKVYKLALSASTSCPNRDGTKSVDGCIFCSKGGSGDFAANPNLDIDTQIENAKALVRNKIKTEKYIAYFQSFTGTYGNLQTLEQIYTKAAMHKDIVAVSIATRPDCLGEKELEMLKRISQIKPLWVELGLQTIHDKTAKLINRCYHLDCYDTAMANLKQIGAHRITHIILGLPHETKQDMLDTVKYVAQRTDGIKLQLLHILKDTKLEKIYLEKPFDVLTQSQYYDIVADCIQLLPQTTVVHRLTGDGPKNQLIAPLWSADKKRVLCDMNNLLNQRGFSRI